MQRRRCRGGHLGGRDERHQRVQSAATNSLVGSTAGIRSATGGVTALTNGNYVVGSPYWDNGADGRCRGSHLGQRDDRHQRCGQRSQQPGGQPADGSGWRMGVTR